MQLDFTLLDKISTTDTPGNSNKSINKAKGQTDTQAIKTPGNKRETPQQRQDSKEKPIEEVIEDLAEHCKIENYTDGVLLKGTAKQEEPPKESNEERLNRIKRNHSIEAPVSPGTERDDIEDTQEEKGENEATEKHTEYSKRVIAKLERKQKAIDKARIIFIEYQDNIKRSEMLRGEIAKGIQNGEEARETLKKAVECISLMTGDKAFFITNTRRLNEIQ